MESLHRRRYGIRLNPFPNLTFTAEEDGTITFTFASTQGYGQSSIEWRKNDDPQWNTTVWSAGGSVNVPVVAGDVIEWRGNGNGKNGRSDGQYSHFSSTGKFRAAGNLLSIVFGASYTPKSAMTGKCGFPRLFEGCTTLTSVKGLQFSSENPTSGYAKWATNSIWNNSWDYYYEGYAFYSTFKNCTGLVDASFVFGSDAEIIKPYTFYSTFEGCANLVYAPTISYGVVGVAGFCNMFKGCSSLTNVTISWGQLANDRNTTGAGWNDIDTKSGSAYKSMFEGCSSLTEVTVPQNDYLSASCYESMFNGCSSIVNAPRLPSVSLAEKCYYQMFAGCTSLTSAPELPATILAKTCYGSMFYGCTSLVQPPSLPATTLAQQCYYQMFADCTSLTSAPELPATTLEQSCYSNMFVRCTSLAQAPSLPATTLAGSCYNNMFYGCTSLTQAPALPATNLADTCYICMFSGCTSLTQAPALPATKMEKSCYEMMFYGCTSLTAAPTIPKVTFASSCFFQMFKGCSSLRYVKALCDPSPADMSNWLSDVASTGTFVKRTGSVWEYTNNPSGIPSGWTVQTVSS